MGICVYYFEGIYNQFYIFTLLFLGNVFWMSKISIKTNAT